MKRDMTNYHIANWFFIILIVVSLAGLGYCLVHTFIYVFQEQWGYALGFGLLTLIKYWAVGFFSVCLIASRAMKY